MQAVDVDSTKEFGRPIVCSVCGGQRFARSPVLWQGLIDEWRLSPEEADYIERQQGTHCVNCRSNLRSIVLATSICEALRVPAPLIDAMAALPPHVRVLEINEAGG